MTFMDYVQELTGRLRQSFLKLRRSMLGRLVAALFNRLAGNHR